MTVKIIYNYDGNDAVVEQPKLNIEVAVQKAFAVCNKIIDTCNYVINQLDIKDLYENYDEIEMFNEEMTDKTRLMHIFSLICGQRVNVLQAIGYATGILQRIKNIADSTGIEVVPDKEEKFKIEYISDDEAIIIGEMIRNLGADYVHEFASQKRAEAGIFDNEERCRRYYADKIMDIKFKNMPVPQVANTCGAFTLDRTVDVDEFTKNFENKIGNPKDSRANIKNPDIIIEHRPKIENKEEKTAFAEYKKAYEQFKQNAEREQETLSSQTVLGCNDIFNNSTNGLDKEDKSEEGKLQKGLIRWGRRDKFDTS